MKKFVVDASVALKWLINEDYSDRAKLLLLRFGSGLVELYAPELLKLEVANGLRKYFVKKLISEEQLITLYSLFSDIDIEYINHSIDLIMNSIKYAIVNDVTFYDALYIVLAKNMNGLFITADDKLMRKIRDKENIIIHIKDYK